MSVVLASLLLANATLGEPPAQALPPGEAKPIVVQGQRTREKQIRNFIRELTPAPPRGQLGRFESPVCPATAGLGRGANDKVSDRLRRVASASGMAVAKAKCHPNVIVIVTGDKAALVKALLKDRSDYFPSASNDYDVDRLLDPKEPVAVWQIEVARGADGRYLREDRSAGVAGKDGVYVQRLYGSASRLSPTARQEFAGAVVVVQADAIDGLTTTQLADYAAMRAFVRTDPTKLTEAAGRSILGIVTTPMGQPVPLTLTQWDLAFLKAYYASRLNTYAANQRSEMGKSMVRDLDSEAEPQPAN